MGDLTPHDVLLALQRLRQDVDRVYDSIILLSETKEDTKMAIKTRRLLWKHIDTAHAFIMDEWDVERTA